MHTYLESVEVLDGEDRLRTIPPVNVENTGGLLLSLYELAGA